MLVSFNFRPKYSLIESFDPRARWIFSLVFLAAVTQFWDIRFLGFFFSLAIVQYVLSRLTWKDTRRAWLFIIVIFSTMILLNTIITSGGTIGSVMSGGRPVISIDWPLPLFGWRFQFTLTLSRLWFALAQMMRLLSIAIVFMVLSFTIDPRFYGVIFHGLRFPDKLAYTLDLAFRFIPTIGRDFQLTYDAQRARGFALDSREGGLLSRLRKFAPLLIPVTMNSILTGEDIVNAMDLRCFGLQRRSWVLELHYRRRDYGVIGLSLVLLIVSLVIRVGFHVGDFWFPGMG